MIYTPWKEHEAPLGTLQQSVRILQECIFVRFCDFIEMIIPEVITARNEVGARLCFLHVSVILFMGGCPSMHCRWYPSMPCRFPGLHRGEVEESGQGGLQTHTQEGSLGVWPGGLQAHTWRGSPGPHPGGRVGVSRPTPRGGVSPGPHQGHVSQHALRQTPLMATAAGGMHPTGMHSSSIDVCYTIPE